MRPQSLGAAVVIPVYKPRLTAHEEVSYGRCLQVLGGRKIVLVAPKGLDLGNYLLEDRDWGVRRFPRRFFSGIAQYNKLMLSPGFYRQFLDYSYILVHQLDAFVFSDQLRAWCAREYDYIGAPWPGGMRIAPISFWGSEHIRRLLPFWNRRRLCYVGNGGFSLRRVRSCIRLLDKHRLIAKLWAVNEDGFFSAYGQAESWFRIPSAGTAAAFSFEKEPRTLYERNRSRLPFGCHAWAKWDIAFWRPIFATLGYDI